VRHPNILRPTVFALVIAAAVTSCSRRARVAADLVITRAHVWTGDAARPDAAAIAIVGETADANVQVDDPRRALAIIAANLPGKTLLLSYLSLGREAQSIAFFSAAGSEPLYSGEAISKPSC